MWETTVTILLFDFITFKNYPRILTVGELQKIGKYIKFNRALFWPVLKKIESLHFLVGRISYLCTKGYKGVSINAKSRCFQNEMIARGPSAARPESYHLI